MMILRMVSGDFASKFQLFLVNTVTLFHHHGRSKSVWWEDGSVVKALPHWVHIQWVDPHLQLSFHLESGG